MNLKTDPLSIWEQRFESHLQKMAGGGAQQADSAHDILHFRRVVATAKRLAKGENGNLEIVIPAAWLHDFVIVPKNDPRRSQASRLSAQAALEFLKLSGFPETYFDEIAHAIEAHSFSAGVEAKTLEAKIVQDADRLDGLGAIGIARCFATAGLMGRAFYCEDDPFCQAREPNDQEFTIDHFYKKLVTIQVPSTLHRVLAEGREACDAFVDARTHAIEEIDVGTIPRASRRSAT